MLAPGHALMLGAAYFMTWGYSVNALSASPPQPAWQPSQGVMGPRGLSDEQIAYWERALSQLQRSADYMALLERHYWTANFMPRREALKYYDAQYAAWKQTLTDLGIAKD